MAQTGTGTVSTGVFDRMGNDSVSPPVFYALLTLFLNWGLVGTALIAYKTIEAHYTPTIVEMIALGLIVPLVGIVIAIASENPLLSFIGYNMVVMPFGLILGPEINQYSANVVRNTCALTGGIVFFMGFMGTCFPRLFHNLGVPLFFALTGLLIARIAQMFIPELQSLRAIDYLAAGIFSLYIGFDMYRASQIPKTIDNAIDVALDLYLDVINLFLSLLRIMSAKSDD